VFGHGTYLLFELTWALPVIAIQWLVGPGCLWASRRLLLSAVGVVTLYLSLADALAITGGIWSISPARTLGLSLGPLPLEEALFFLVTNVMVVQSIVLIRSDEPWLRVKRLFGHGS
jgi:lycopene cyclase domain-containing protein